MKKSPALRLDQWLVEHGRCESREQAQRLILAGEVWMNGHRADKPSLRVAPDASIEVRAQERYVSRGGKKLEAALTTFKISPTAAYCLDVGSSTGGFTDCLLQHGAVHVTALDVGRGQLHWKLRQDLRVTVMEEVNARLIQPTDLPYSYDLAVMDLSFISLRLVLPAIFPVMRSESQIIALIKPQFEVGKDQVGKGGIVRDPKLHTQVVEELQTWLAQRYSTWKSAGIIPSPILGREGNREFLWHLTHLAA